MVSKGKNNGRTSGGRMEDSARPDRTAAFRQALLRQRHSSSATSSFSDDGNPNSNGSVIALSLSLWPSRPLSSTPLAPLKHGGGCVRKKTVIQKSPRAKIFKLPEKPRPSTRSKDQAFTPSPSPPTSPPRTDPMARTKTTLTCPSSAKLMAPPSSPSKPSTSKGKRPATEEPTPEPSRPKPRSAPNHP
nr:proteoglycan 4-like [Arachis hypogaea]